MKDAVTELQCLETRALLQTARPVWGPGPSGRTGQVDAWQVYDNSGKAGGRPDFADPKAWESLKEQSS